MSYDPIDFQGPAWPRQQVDPHVEAVRAKLRARSIAGQQKYGTTLARTDLDDLDWIRHAQEEALDLAVYLERLASDLARSTDDGR
jgi:hypothetical protein